MLSAITVKLTNESSPVSGMKPPWNVAIRYLVARKEALPLRKNCIAEMNEKAQI